MEIGVPLEVQGELNKATSSSGLAWSASAEPKVNSIVTMMAVATAHKISFLTFIKDRVDVPISNNL